MDQIVLRVTHEAGLLSSPARCAPISPRVRVNIRPGTLADIPFIDRLQKAQTREVGFLPTAALEGKIRLGEVLMAEQNEPRALATGFSPAQEPIAYASGSLGYLIAADRYFKRDEIGYITQINVLPEYRRSLVAAALVQAQFDRSAYGCKLYGCWCAQDLKANEFWAAMGFTAIAFRTGSRSKGKDAAGKKSPRIHIFWQKRVRADDLTTPWWYPSTTGGGELREDRLVFPIPPGVSWRDVLPAVLPNEPRALATGVDQLPVVSAQTPVMKKKSKAKTHLVKKLVEPPHMKGGLWWMIEVLVEEPVRKSKPAKPARALAPLDPRLKKMARELRDRWTEQSAMILPGIAKHDVRRSIAAANQNLAGEFGLGGGSGLKLPINLALPEAA